MATQKILSNFASNPKTRKALDFFNIEGSIMHLASADSVSELLGRKVTTCPLARLNKCDTGCLDHQGRGRMDSVTHARLKKTARFFNERSEFIGQLRGELSLQEKRAAKKGKRSVARLDGTSDLGLAEGLSPEFPGTQFLDYTKVTARYLRWIRGRKAGRFANYSLTYSLGAGNRSDAIEVLQAGGNVAVVFRLRKGQPLPDKWEGFDVIDGDLHDFRFLDPENVVVGLRSKGTSYHDRSGFVQEPTQ